MGARLLRVFERLMERGAGKKAAEKLVSKGAKSSKLGKVINSFADSPEEVRRFMKLEEAMRAPAPNANLIESSLGHLDKQIDSLLVIAEDASKSAIERRQARDGLKILRKLKAKKLAEKKSLPPEPEDLQFSDELDDLVPEPAPMRPEPATLEENMKRKFKKKAS